jgi:ryanodine receptor 2
VLAENAHEIWARQLKNRLAAIGNPSLSSLKSSLSSLGGGLHPRLVPYHLLTDTEKQKDLKFYQDLVKYLNIFGYRVVK